MKLIGLSLSFCVRDIAAGNVPIEAVQHIVSACSPRNEAEVQNEILTSYLKSYWRADQQGCLTVFNELRESRRIMWCADWEKRAIMIGNTNWLPFPDVNDDFTVIKGFVTQAINEWRPCEHQ